MAGRRKGGEGLWDRIGKSDENKEDEQIVVFCWGWGEDGRLGLGDEENHYDLIEFTDLPIKGANLSSFVAGYHHSALLSSARGMWMFGDNRQGQLGLGDLEKRLVPIPVPFFAKTFVTSVALGLEHSLGVCFFSFITFITFVTALTAAGVLYSWGRNNFGQLGVGDRLNRITPTLVFLLFNFIVIYFVLLYLLIGGRVDAR
jgi:alpha-tubulin suppressor-like RCC1 family protein